MAVTSVSLPNDLFAQMMSKQLSPSKVFRLGLDLALGGGAQAYNEIKAKNEAYQSEIIGLQDQIEIMKVKLENTRNEVRFLREKYVLKTQEQEDVEEKELDKLLKERKGSKPS